MLNNIHAEKVDCNLIACKFYYVSLFPKYNVNVTFNGNLMLYTSLFSLYQYKINAFVYVLNY